jgi:hypothetical protein
MTSQPRPATASASPITVTGQELEEAVKLAHE